ncbi:MAG: pilus assembly protein [Oscillochloridaceae bacterium]|nr:pilus assembly protein [Chloroflexaceae bacterium]MDW8388977.1 pilus assembly protein [Oscillochloridaceae bacterium]
MLRRLRTHRRQPRARGQALVELALASTLLFFLLAAAVDLGLIFFTLQGLRAAAQEGATFGSYPVQVMQNGQLQRVDLNYAEIVRRVRGAGGPQRSGFANLRDLDNNGIWDENETGRAEHTDWSNPNAYIRIELLYSTIPPQPDQQPPPRPCRTDMRGIDMQAGGRNCWVRVTVRTDYQFMFPLAPAFANSVRLQTSAVMPIRSSYANTPNQ